MTLIYLVVIWIWLGAVMFYTEYKANKMMQNNESGWGNCEKLYYILEKGFIVYAGILFILLILNIV